MRAGRFALRSPAPKPQLSPWDALASGGNVTHGERFDRFTGEFRAANGGELGQGIKHPAQRPIKKVGYPWGFTAHSSVDTGVDMFFVGNKRFSGRDRL